MDINELLRRKGRVVESMRALLKKAEDEKRQLTSEEEAQWTAMNDDCDKIQKQIDQERRTLDLERTLGDSRGATPLPAPADGQRDVPRRETPEYGSAFSNFLQRGLRNLREQETRALQADSDTAGGYVVVPQQFMANLIQAVDNDVAIRRFATRIAVPNAESLGIPVLATDIADANWTKEIATGSEDSSMAFGKRELHPHPLAKLIKVSNKLIRAAAINIEALVRSRLAYKFGVTEENSFLNGSGSEEPLGLFIALTSAGITTSRDVSTGNTTTAFTADGLINAKYNLKAQYMARPSTRWIFHRDAVKMARKLKDGNGQYLWQAGLASDRPDTILDIPYIMSEYAPNTFTTGLYVGLIGDLSFYWIADALDMTVQRVDELYAATNQTGFIGRLECDGMPVLEEAFTRVKLA